MVDPRGGAVLAGMGSLKCQDMDLEGDAARPRTFMGKRSTDDADSGRIFPERGIGNFELCAIWETFFGSDGPGLGDRDPSH